MRQLMNRICQPSLRTHSKRLTLFSAALALLALAGCSRLPGATSAQERPLPPQDQLNFHRLYSENCAACHGKDGQNGPAIDLGNPEYQALADDNTLRRWISSGEPGTQMPAFAQSAGGMLTDAQVNAVIAGMRKNWAKPDPFGGQTPPPYAQDQKGDAQRGQAAYQTFCARCHTAPNHSITDPAYLALVGDQALRSIILAGRPDLGQPDWRSDAPGQPLSAQNVTDIVTYLGSLRSATPGQPYPEHQ